MKIGMIGCGFIGGTIAQTAEEMDGVEKILLFDIDGSRSRVLEGQLKKAELVDTVEKLIKGSTLVVEAASQEAVAKYGPQVLESGADLMLLSVGALSREGLLEKLQDLAKKKGANIYIPSGAIAGLDGVKSASMASIEEVTLVTTKPVAGLKGAPVLEEKGIDISGIAEPLVVFDGTAREAVEKFPKNINVAATLSLCGVGLDRTRVKIIADPGASRNKHRICVKGRFGKLTIEVLNQPSMTNPKTSYLAALSAIACLKKIVDRVWIGT